MFMEIDSLFGAMAQIRTRLSQFVAADQPTAATWTMLQLVLLREYKCYIVI